MKKVIVFLLVFCIIASSSAITNASYYEGIEDGKRAADQKHSSMGYWLAGLPAAFFLSPLLGGGATIITAYSSNPSPDNRTLMSLEREEYSMDYIRGFEKGYQDRAKSKNTGAAWGSTGIAFAARLAIIMSLDNNYANDSFEPINQVPVLNFQF